MIDRMQSRIAFAAFVIIVAAILVTVVLSSIGGGFVPGSSSGDENSRKRIIAYTVSYNRTAETTTAVPDFVYVKMQELSSTTATRFLTPFGRTMSSHFPQEAGDTISDPDASMTMEQRVALLEGADAFEQYVLIRLPESLVGATNNVSAFRAYSAMDPESNCLLGYRHDLGTGVTLQDPCHSDIFRASDGYSCFGRIAIGTNPVVSSYNALPRMDLSVDDQGYLLASKPDGRPHGDGTVGEGRMMPAGEIQSGSELDDSCVPYTTRP